MRTHRRLAACLAAVPWWAVPAHANAIVATGGSGPRPAVVAQAPVTPPGDQAPIQFRIESHDVYVTPPGRPFAIHARNHSRKVVVAYGVRILARDARARLQPRETYVVRPRYEFAPRREQPVSLPLAAEPPAYQLQATFALYDDGTWWGNPDQARREMEAFREEFAVMTALEQVLVSVGESPTRDDVRAIAERCARLLATTRSRRARQHLEAALRTLATGLDETTRAGRPYAETLAVVRDRVDRARAGYERLGFVRRAAFRS